MKSLISVALLLSGPVEPGVAAADKVDSFRCDTAQRVNSENVQRVHIAYSARSVAIVRAALASDARKLESLVHPSAVFEIFKGDSGATVKAEGAKAAMEFAKRIAPQTYQFSTESDWPISMDPCGAVTSKLIFKGRSAHEGVSVEFKYHDGILQGAKAFVVEIWDGAL